jgi:hypothetical protein
MFRKVLTVSVAAVMLTGASLAATSNAFAIGPGDVIVSGLNQAAKRQRQVLGAGLIGVGLGVGAAAIAHGLAHREPRAIVIEKNSCWRWVRGVGKVWVCD